MTNHNQMTPQELLKTLESNTSDASLSPDSAGVKAGISAKKVFKWMRDIAYILLIGMLIFMLVSVLSARSKGQTPELFGFRLYAIETGSMLPTLEVGSIILVRRPINDAQLDIGDIITFSISDTTVVTHRIIDYIILEDGSIAYQTKGDNPINSPDRDPVLPEQVEGVFILKIPLT